MSKRGVYWLMHRNLSILFLKRSSSSSNPFWTLLKEKDPWFSFRCRRFSHIPHSPVKASPATRTASAVVKRRSWLQMGDRGFAKFTAGGWYGGLKSTARRFRSQALESYCLWHGPLLKVCHPLIIFSITATIMDRVFVGHFGPQRGGCWSQVYSGIRAAGCRALQWGICAPRNGFVLPWSHH